MSTKPSNDIFIPLKSNLLDKSTSKYEALYGHIKEAIFNGRLKTNDKLPSSRYLSKLLGISRNSILTAYELLLSEGFIESRQGSGTFVADAVDLKPLLGSGTNIRFTSSSIHVSKIGQRVNATDLLSPVKAVPLERKESVFLPAQPAMDCFPYKEWQSAVTKSLRNPSAFSEQPVMGVCLLREQIQEFLLITRGVRCHADDIMITSGSQQALSIVLNLLVSDGDNVLLEDIGFKGIDAVLSSLGAVQMTLTVDEQGICFDKLSEVCQQAKTLVLTPSRSFPLGHTLSLQRRLSILEWAYETQGWVIEDDYDSEFIFSGHSIASLQGLDSGGRVIYTGTYSRTMFPGIRLGYIVLPPVLVPLFNKFKRIVDGGISAQQQVAMGLFMQSGAYSRHLRRMRKLYKKRKAILDPLMQQMLPMLSLIPSEGGMHSVYHFQGGQDDVAIAREANQYGLGVRPLSSYQRNDVTKHASYSGLIIGYAGTTEEHIQKGVIKLRHIIDDFCKKS